jgi:hypothetical protein
MLQHFLKMLQHFFKQKVEPTFFIVERAFFENMCTKICLEKILDPIFLKMIQHF